MDPLSLLISYFQWRIKSKTRHGVHSPFLYRFLDECVYADSEKNKFAQLEAIRKQLIHNETKISYRDPGAGQRFKRKQQKQNEKVTSTTISEITRKVLQKPRYCRLLYRMIGYFEAEQILELGTSLGITTSYMAMAGKNIKIDTIEGVEVIAQNAQKVFDQNNLKNVSLHVGNFDLILEDVVNSKQYDLIFLDGNHRGEKVLEYFSLLSKHIKEDGVLIIDDIRWSASMYKAWKNVRKKHGVTLTVDMFRMGMVFFNPDLQKENFAIRF